MHRLHNKASMRQITHERSVPRRSTEGHGRLRILQVVPTYFPAVRYGGPIRSVHALSKALAEQGHEVHVFTSSMDGPGDLAVPLATPVNIDGVLVRYFPVPRLRRLCWCPALLSTLKREAAAFDLLHLHSVYQWPTWAAARAAHEAGVPYVLSPRGMLGLEVIRRKNPWVKSAWIRLIERRTLRDAAGLHVTAELEREEIQALQLALPRIFCVPNGVNWPDLRPGLAAGPFADIAKPYALFLSRIDAKKGLDRLLAAWRWVPDLTLIIAGNDENGYRRTLEKIIEENGLDARIRFVGLVSDEHKWALYEHAAMFILPSYSENFGNVVAEAMAMGCPVVVTPEVGLASFVRESAAGVVVDGAPDALAQAIRRLLSDVPGRRLMGERGKAAALRHLSWESAARSMQAVYSDICGRDILAGPDNLAGRANP
jgi:glycosyltransferase involved in cell wall biosynthesis